MKANSKTKHVNEHYIKQDSNHDELHRSRELAQGIVCTKPTNESHDTDTTLYFGGYIEVITVKGVWLLLIKDGTIKPPAGGTYETDSTFSVLNLQQQPSWPVHISLHNILIPSKAWQKTNRNMQKWILIWFIENKTTNSLCRSWLFFIHMQLCD